MFTVQRAANGASLKKNNEAIVRLGDASLSSQLPGWRPEAQEFKDNLCCILSLRLVRKR